MYTWSDRDPEHAYLRVPAQIRAAPCPQRDWELARGHKNIPADVREHRHVDASSAAEARDREPAP